MKKLIIPVCALLLTAGAVLLSLKLNKEEAAPEADSSEFVTITDAVPDAILEIRYFSTYNFVGERIDGYLEPTALLTKRAADSLRAVSDELLTLGYRIKIFDAYRPQCAVDHFVRKPPPYHRRGAACGVFSRYIEGLSFEPFLYRLEDYEEHWDDEEQGDGAYYHAADGAHA